MSKMRYHEVEVTEAEAGLRLDKALSKIFTDYSRSIIKEWIDAGRVSLNFGPCRPRDIVRCGDTVHLTAVLEGTTGLVPEVVDFNVVHIDDVSYTHLTLPTNLRV